MSYRRYSSKVKPHMYIKSNVISCHPFLSTLLVHQEMVCLSLPYCLVYLQVDHEETSFFVEVPYYPILFLGQFLPPQSVFSDWEADLGHHVLLFDREEE